MHLTVRFIGHVADDRASAIVEAVRLPIDLASFDVTLGQCGVFPPGRPPRVLWIGVKEGLLSLAALHAEFNRRLAPLGFQPEERPYSAHLTLARVKDAPRGSTSAARAAVQSVVANPARCRISEVTLFESRLSPKGPTYTPLLRIPLRS